LRKIILTKSPFLTSKLTNSVEQLNNLSEFNYKELNMNKKQKYIIVTGLLIISVVLIFWLTQGAEIFTKTQVLVDKTSELDKMLGVENKQYVDKFVLGLDYAGAFSGIVVIISGFLTYLFRNKRKDV